jgi:hypothetical protein
MTDATQDAFLNKRELAYALALRELLPIEGGSRKLVWARLRDMIRDDYVRPSRHHQFNAVSERGQ